MQHPQRCKSRFVPGRAAAAALVLCGLTAQPTQAFFQTTEFKGPIGRDIGGAWLAVHHVAPEFRSQIQFKDGDKEIPFLVKELKASDSAYVLEPAGGLLITGFKPGHSGINLGLEPGDLILRANEREVKTQVEFDSVVEAAGTFVMLQIRRLGMAFTTARILKITYKHQAATDGETTTIGSEFVRLSASDSDVPFRDALDATRTSHEVWEPDEKTLADLAANWATLPRDEPQRHVRAENRVVTAGAYDAALATDAELVGTEFAMIVNLTGNPLMGGGKSISVYGVREMKDDFLTGTFSEAAIGSAPFPIAVEFKGGFKMYKIGDDELADAKHRAANLKVEEEEDLDSFELAPEVPEDVR